MILQLIPLGHFLGGDPRDPDVEQVKAWVATKHNDTSATVFISRFVFAAEEKIEDFCSPRG